jgi:hypothetical protein
MLPETEGPTHRYMESSPACWSAYSGVLAREYANRGLFERVHRSTVDAYAVQHPGRPSAQAIQSVAAHLMSLCVMLEKGATPDKATGLIRRAVARKGSFTWLKPPADMGAVTVADVWNAKDETEHGKRAGEWAASAWKAWSDHHPTIRSWCSSI